MHRLTVYCSQQTRGNSFISIQTQPFVATMFRRYTVQECLQGEWCARFTFVVYVTTIRFVDDWTMGIDLSWFAKSE